MALRRCIWFLACLVLLPVAWGCNRGPAPAVVNGPKSPPGWEVRYNATIALARRGSNLVKDESVWENLLEILDEEQQLRNFRRPQKEGSAIEVTDSGSAQLAVITALQAINELHRRRPEMDVAGLKPALDKLAKSGNMAVNTEAKRTQQLLALKN